MSAGRRSALAAIPVIALFSSACSMLFMTRPPQTEGPVARGDCTRSAAAPLIDGVLGLNSLAVAAGIYGQSRDAFESDNTYTAYRVTSAVSTGALAFSAIHGFMWSAECRRRTTLSEQAIRDHLRVLAARQLGDQQQQPW